MSTRSGKRIHNSYKNENFEDSERENIEVKTRNKRKRDKEVEKKNEKKRKHYVKYPSEESIDNNESDEAHNRKSRKSTRNTLKDLNTNNDASEETDEHVVRHTRKTKKIEEEENSALTSKKKHEKKGKKKHNNKKKCNATDKKMYEDDQTNELYKKKSKKIKNKNRSGSIIIEDLNKDDSNDQHPAINTSNMSVDSFHSAGGSPTMDKVAYHSVLTKNEISTPLDTVKRENINRPHVSPVLNDSHSKKKSLTDSNELRIPLTNSNSETEIYSNTKTLNTTIDKDNHNSAEKKTINKKRKSSVSNGSFVKTDSLEVKSKHSTDVCLNGENDVKISRKSLRLSNAKSNFTKEYLNNVDSKIDSTFNNVENVNKILDKSPNLNLTFEKIIQNDTECEKISDTKEKNNMIFDKSSDSYAVKNDLTFDKITETNLVQKNITFEKHSDIDSKDNNFEETSTLDKTVSNSEKCNETYDKVTNNDSLLSSDTSKMSKSSLLSSDTSKMSKGSLISSDTSKNSHISLTSDESITENILNSSPHLVDSSTEETQSDSKTIKSPNQPVLNKKSPVTPLKREGTFTKESPEVIMPKTRNSLNVTPTRRKSLPSPGSTPFPSNLKKTPNERNVLLNVTHSLEKSRRSSLVDLLPRATKVMFCSPSNNPIVVSQMKRKVIKSSLKGSNKSFIFDDSEGPPSPARLAGRKRSQTHGMPESTAKRSRLLSDAPQPEWKRARTVSATAKIDVATPTKKIDTPTKSKVGRTKLPNFAALHQKQFDKMESLDECQERKAKRAKQLLTPTGSVSKINQISPKETQVTVLPAASQLKKLETPTKVKAPQTNPGYSRFGFKLNLDTKPFKFSANTEVKSNQPKLKRQVTMPSLIGTTLTRKDVAKQTVLKEKSFIRKRDDNRKESRTVIKGVRTNRRFELQMKMRNING